MGGGAAPDMAHANTFLGWNYDGYYSHHLSVEGVRKLKERGGKVIIIDIRCTPAAKNLADIFLQINPGTDGGPRPWDGQAHPGKWVGRHGLY